MQTLSIDQLVGQTLGNYRVERLMGQGRLSAVYLAQNTVTSMNGALTLFIVPVRFSQDAHARFIQRFRNEAGALTALQHPHVLPVHEYGEYQGHPYLITPYMTNGSLADIVKSEGCCDHVEALDILEQVVAGLEYAHRKGVIHGTLKPSNIVLGDDQHMMVAGFGLMHMLQMRGIEQDDRPYGHLLSIADTFLAAPEYIAPEVVQGQSIDKRSDVYALGIILFELLSGKPPFSGQKPLDVAKMHVEQSIPSLRMLNPAIPAVLASVINQALDRDPARRFQSASELVEAFAQASLGATGSVRRLDKAPITPSAPVSDRGSDLPETPAQGYATGNWQLMPPIVTSKVKIVNSVAKEATRTAPTPPTGNTDSWQFLPPVVTGSLEAVDVPARSAPVPPSMVVRAPQKSQPLQAPLVKSRTAAPPTLIPSIPEQALPVARPPQEDVASLPWQEPVMPPARTKAPMPEKKQDWWEQVPQDPMALPAADENQWDTPWSYPSTAKSARPAVRRKRKNGIGRRKAIALLAAGGAGVVAASGLGVSIANGSTGGAQATNQVTNQQPNNLPAGGIATTKMPANTSLTFGDNKKNVLVHLADGNFVAYDRACTHVGVFVNYDPATRMLVCPAHGAIFDPAQNAKVVQGPATTPLKTVKVSVHPDGTITMV